MANASGVGHVVDKMDKIVQVFQGLICHPTDGMTYDSDNAKSICTVPGSFVWQSDQGDSYDVTVQGILAVRCNASGRESLPRIVSKDLRNPRLTRGFGQNIYQANLVMRGSRQGPSFLVERGTLQAEVNEMGLGCARQLLCDAGGKIANDEFSFYLFNDNNIDSAGRPKS